MSATTLQFVSPAQRAIERNPSAILTMPKEKANKKMWMLAISKDFNLVGNVPKSFLGDEDMQAAIAAANYEALKHAVFANPMLVTQLHEATPELWVIACQKQPDLLVKFPKELFFPGVANALLQSNEVATYVANSDLVDLQCMFVAQVPGFTRYIATPWNPKLAIYAFGDIKGYEMLIGQVNEADIIMSASENPNMLRLISETTTDAVAVVAFDAAVSGFAGQTDHGYLFTLLDCMGNLSQGVWRNILFKYGRQMAASGVARQYHITPADLHTADPTTVIHRARKHVRPATDDVIQSLMTIEDLLSLDGMKLQTLSDEEKTVPLVLIAIRSTPAAIRFVNTDAPEMMQAVYSAMPSMIRYAKVQTPEMCRIAVAADPSVLQFVKHKTQDIIDAAAVPYFTEDYIFGCLC